MKLITIIALLVISHATIAQKNEFRFDGVYGYAIGETNAYKKAMLVKGVGILGEFSLKHNLCFTTGFGVNSLIYSIDNGANNNTFFAKSFICVPLTIKGYISVNNKNTSFVFLNMGISGNYLFNSKEENRVNSILNTTTKTGLGFNIAGITSFGFKTLIRERVFYNINFGTITDFVSSYKNDADKIKAETTFFSTGVSFQFK